MNYKLHPNLFVEHGPAALARQSRTSAREYQLLRKATAEREPRPLDKAA